MADNVPITAGVGTDIATDEIAGVNYQRIKLTLGADGVNGGDVAPSNPMPVVGTTVDGAASSGAMLLVGGQTAGGIAQAFETNASGHLNVADGGGSLTVDATSWPLPTGAATETTLAALNTKVPAQGQALMAASTPVVIASNQSAVPVSGTVTANAGTGTFAVSGPLTDTQLRASAVPVSAASLPLPTGASTETTLAALNTKTPAVGQTTMAGSRPVVIASDQSTININSPGVSASGTIAALNASVELVLNGAAGFSIDVRGTFVATLTFQGTLDGTNWFNINTMAAGSGFNITPVQTTTAVGAWTGHCPGYLRVRATATAFTSGTATVTIRATTTPALNYMILGAGSVISAGTALIGDVGVQARATTNGTTITNILSAASNNLTQLKGTSGKIAGGFLTNTTASLQYLKLFALPSASVTMGTTAATTQIALQPNQTVNLTQADLGIFLGGTGITIAITTGSSLTDNTATTAGSVVGFIAWV